MDSLTYVNLMATLCTWAVRSISLLKLSIFLIWYLPIFDDNYSAPQHWMKPMSILVSCALRLCGGCASFEAYYETKSLQQWKTEHFVILCPFNFATFLCFFNSYSHSFSHFISLLITPMQFSNPELTLLSAIELYACYLKYIGITWIV